MKKLLLSISLFVGFAPAFAGTGTETDPYTCAEVIAMGADLNVASATVKGYIVGNATGQSITDTALFEQSGDSKWTASNVLIADDAACTDPALCVPVQLVSKTDIRAAVNLLDNPGNKGKLLSITGQLTKYFGVPGVKSPTAYAFDGEVVTPPTPAENVKVTDIADFFGKAQKGTVYEFTAPVTVVMQSGNNLWVQDAHGSLQVYGSVGQTYNTGDVIPAGFSGAYDMYIPSGSTVGTPELVAPLAGFQAASSTGAELRVVEFPVEEIETGLVNAYIKVAGVDVVKEGTNYFATQDGSKIQLIDKFKINIAEGSNLNVEGIVTIYKDVAQMYPMVITDASGVVVEKAAKPTFTPNGGAVIAGTEVTISCATEGATIYYTTDGTEPTTASEVYSAPIVVEEAMTIKAIAVATDMEDSEVAVAEFTIRESGAYLGEFDTFNEGNVNTSYSTYTNATGWTAANCAILGKASLGELVEEGTLAPTMNGKTTAVGTITSPTLTEGIGTLTFDYALPFSDTKINFDVIVTPANGVEVKETVAVDSATKLTKYSFSKVIETTGDFTIKLVNNSPSNATSNKDRTAIFNLTWNHFSTGITNVEAQQVAGAVEYYNLQGQRVANPEGGLFIRRQGNTVEKVVIR